MAEPEALDIEIKRTALIIIDRQRDFLQPGDFGEPLGRALPQTSRAPPPEVGVVQ